MSLLLFEGFAARVIDMRYCQKWENWEWQDEIPRMTITKILLAPNRPVLSHMHSNKDV